MATVDECFQLLKYRANKSGFNGYISSNDFNLIWPRAEIRYFNKLYGNQNDYQYGRPLPKIGYSVTQKVSESLSKFVSDPIAITIDGAGKYTFPADVFHIDAITHTYNGIQQEVIRVEKDRLANNLSSTYDAPDLQFPIYTEYSTFLQFYPINLATATLIYLKKPTKTKWNYTLVSGREVYASVGSVQPLWNDIDIDEIIYICLADIGINMKDAGLVGFANQKTQTGV